MHNKFLACILLIVSLAVPLCLFSYTAYNSYGYDDEYFNIKHVVKYDSVSELVRSHLSGQFLDIHPLGQYVINYTFLKLFGNWHLVRVAGAIIASLSLWLFWRYSAKKYTDTMSVLLSYVLICLNPSAMLWCTGVRWYTYMLPLVCIIGVLFTSSTTRKYLFWGVYFATASAMFYLETSAAIMILVSFVLLLFQRRARLKDEYIAVLSFGLLALLIVAPQIYIFLTVLYPSVSGSGEFYSLFRSFVGGGQNFLTGHAVVPVSAAGMMLLVANLVMFLVFIMHIKTVEGEWRNKFFTLSYAGIILAKIGGKIRNFISLSALQGDLIADTFTQLRNKALKTAVLVLYAAGTVWGIHNVVLHTDTTKGSWNTPYGEVLAFLKDYDPSRRHVILSHDPVFSYNAEAEGFRVIWADADHEWLSELGGVEGDVAVLRTFRGSMPDEEFAKFNGYINSRKVLREEKFGYDKFASFKRKFDKDCPDYYAVIMITAPQP